MALPPPRRLNDYIDPPLSPVDHSPFHLPSTSLNFLITIADRNPSPLYDRGVTNACGRFTTPVSSLMATQFVNPSVRSELQPG
jgi:hypothetical protein